MRTRTIAVLVTIAFSVIGVLGDYFLKLASAREQSRDQANSESLCL